jgi:hypothetical protein
VSAKGEYQVPRNEGLEKDSKTTENQKKNLSRSGESYINQENYTKVKKRMS